MENLGSNNRNSKTTLFYGFSFVIFSILLIMRESDRFNNIFDFLPILGGSIPYFILTILLVLINKSKGGNLKDFGLAWPSHCVTKRKALTWLISRSLVITFTSLVAGSIVMESFDLIVGSTTEVLVRKSPLIGNFSLLLFITPLMWLAVVGEELLFRGFIMNYMAKKLGGSTISWVLAILISSLIFGLAHFWEGHRGMVGAGVLALIWGSSYLLCNRNLWPVIIAHSILNSIGFISTFNS